MSDQGQWNFQGAKHPTQSLTAWCSEIENTFLNRGALRLYSTETGKSIVSSEWATALRPYEVSAYLYKHECFHKMAVEGLAFLVAFMVLIFTIAHFTDGYHHESP